MTEVSLGGGMDKGVEYAGRNADGILLDWQT